MLGAANEHDSTRALDTLVKIRLQRNDRGRPRTRPKTVHADAAYDSGEIRRDLRCRQIRGNIPENPRGRKRPKRGRPYRLDKATFYPTRNCIERFFGWMKSFRRVVIRYERRLDCFAAFVYLACYLITTRVLR